MATFSDVTDSERMALALRERNEVLEAAEEMRAAVLDRISHRLRTPLNTIFGFGQLIADSRFGELSEAQRGYADGILESARHLLATIDDVTGLATLEIGSLHDHGSEMSLSDLLMLTGRLLERRATEEGVELRVTVEECNCELAGDADRLRQIVFNMTTDAIGRCGDGGRVELGARCLDGRDGAEVYTLETWSGSEPADPARAEAASPAVPFIRRLAAQAGGSFELRAGGGAVTLSAVCRFPLVDGPDGTEPG
jgi:signal transduction histidine kinase